MRDSLIEAERRVLEALCQGLGKEEAGTLLRNYAWREPSHQVLFSALTEISSTNSEVIRAELPARLVRKGFPDLDWEHLFRASPSDKEETLALMRRLAGAA